MESLEKELYEKMIEKEENRDKAYYEAKKRSAESEKKES